MFVSVVLNTEYMDIASRSKWYLKCLLHCKQNGWILITHEYMKTHIEELQKEITPSLFSSWEMQPFEYEDVKDVEQYFIPDSVFVNLEKEYGSRTEMLFVENSKQGSVLYKHLTAIFYEISKKHADTKVDGIFNILESFECLRVIADKLKVPLINYSFSAIRKPHGYRQTLFHVNQHYYWSQEECERRWNTFKNEGKGSLPIFTNREIIAILGKDRTLPLLQLMNSTPKYEMGVCCEFYSMLPQVFANNPYTDDDIFYECKKKFGKEQIKVRSHSLHLDDIQVDRTEVHNDPASFILSCKRLTAVQSQIILKALLWGRTGVMVKDTLAFSFLCSKDYDGISKENLLGLNFFIFGYLIPSDLMFSDDYWKWRLTNPTETEICLRHMEFLFNYLGIDIEQVMKLEDKDRFRYLLESRNCDKQLIESLLEDETVENINWDVASSRFDIVSKSGTKSYWRIDTVNKDGSLCTQLTLDVKDATTVIFFPLDDVAGFTCLNKVIINGDAVEIDKKRCSFNYMPKNRGAYTFTLDCIYTGELTIDCTWRYKKVLDYLNEQ